MQDKQVAAEASLVDQTNLLPRRQLLTVFGVLAISLFICFVDQNDIGVILPTISRNLDAADTISWAGTSALIANTVFQVLFGRLSDLFGRKVVFLSALILLAICDLLCGFSQNAVMLYVFRALAGVANGGITSLSMMIVSDIVTLKERGKYQGILGACVGLGNMVGPFIAAAFAQHSTWRGLFWLSSKLDIRIVIRKIDYWGILFGSAAIVLILIPVSGGGSYFAWDSPLVISMLAVGGSCALAFIFIEYKIALLPMMPLSLFANAPVCVLLVQNFLFGIVYYSQLYYLPLFFQNARQMSPMTSAALVLPITAAQMTLSILSGQYISRRERYGEVIWTGFFLWTLGVGLTCLFDLSTPIAAIVVILLIQGAGVGLIFQPSLVALQAHCFREQRAVVISNRNFLRSLGGAVGLAISAAALQNSLKKAMPPEISFLLSSYDTPDFEELGASPEQIQAVLQAYATASRTVFIMNAPFMGLCLIGCILIKDRGLQRPNEAQQIASLDRVTDVAERGREDKVAGVLQSVHGASESELTDDAKGLNK
ncbi:MFS general substrate transporter, partial [Aureobasidium melanogenum]